MQTAEALGDLWHELRRGVFPSNPLTALIGVMGRGDRTRRRNPLRKVADRHLQTDRLHATVVRMVLVPAVMQLLGRANWWSPRWLERILPVQHERPAPAERWASARSISGSRSASPPAPVAQRRGVARVVRVRRRR